MRAATERFCDEVLRARAPALAVLWLSEPDYTGHHTPLGSPAHRRAIASADANVRRVAETVAALDPSGERILFVVGSDHGMETVDETIDLDGLLLEAGLKRAPASSDVVVAPNGTAALLYFAEPAGALVGQVARFLETQDWIGRTFVGDALAEVGLPTRSPAQIALTLRPDERANPHGVSGYSHIVRDLARTERLHRLRPAWRARQQRAAPVPVRLRRRLRPRGAARAVPRSSTSRRRCCGISVLPPPDGRPPLPR